jgi:dTDP-4-amino-4,6-dideoxy-D-galactose acyltransferase
LIRITSDDWLGSVMGRAAYRVDTDGTAVAEELAVHERDQKKAFYFAKVPADRVAVLRTLARVGFDVVDVNITFAKTPPSAPQRLLVDVGECSPQSADAVLDIAGSCFKYTRFHLDPRVDDTLAHRIKREWIRSYVRKKRGDRLFVAYMNGTPAGFLAALVADRAGVRTAIIDLVGVGAGHQRKGVGESLVNAFVEHYRGSSDSLAVGTQIANVPSVRLYEKLGFSLAASEYVLHKHVPDV